MSTKNIKIFLGAIVLLIIIFSLKLYSEHREMQTIKEYSIKYEAKAITDIMISFRRVYQDAFVQNHIKLTKSSANLLPVKTTNTIAEYFASLNGDVKISTVSYNPRNLKNKANYRQEKIIKFFEKNPNKTEYFKKQDNDSYIYSYPIYIKKSCLKCHAKKENAPRWVQDNYDKAYDYKLGDLRAIMEVELAQNKLSIELDELMTEKFIFAVSFFLVLVILLFLFASFTQKEDAKKSYKNPRLKLLFVLIFTILYLVIYYFNSMTKTDKIKTQLNSSIKELKTNYNISMHYHKEDSKAMMMLLSNKNSIKNILSKALDADDEQKAHLREKLYKIVEPQFRVMQTKGVNILLFATPDNKIFLRMHKPLKYGDDISKIRYGIKVVNETKEPVFGLESGKFSHAFRHIYPIFSKEKYLGCVDISYSSDNLQNKLNNINKIHTHFLVSKDVINKKIWKSKTIKSKYSQSIEHPSYMRAKVKNSVHKNVELCQKTVSKKRAIIDTNIKKDKEFTVYDEFENSSVVVAFIPIQNIKGSKIPAAYLVSYTKDKNIDIILNIAKVINIVALEKNTKQLQALQQQNKMASMGEMIGAIAHQWRQPLSAISGAIQNLEYDYEDGYLKDKKYINDFVDKQKKTINFMSKTIDDFRSFFRVDKTKRNFKVKETTQNVIDMQSAQLKNHNITLNISGDELEFNGLQSEYQQAILNIINNAKDALIENNIENPTIDIAISNRKVTIKDNGGGIHQDVIDRVFEPYFSTKEQGKGVGMGLYISKMIIDDNMGAKLSVENDKNGAVFTIDLNEYHTPK